MARSVSSASTPSAATTCSPPGPRTEITAASTPWIVVAASSVRVSTSSRSIEPDELAERAAAPSLGPGSLERRAQIAGQLLHPLVDVGERRREVGLDAVVAPPSQPRHEQEEECGAGGAEGEVGSHGRKRFR